MTKIILITFLLSLILGTLSCDDRTSRSYEVVDPEITASQDTATTISERSARHRAVRQINESINGEIIYMYQKDSTGALTEKLLAFKHKDQDEYFRIAIRNDTINLNEQFEGSVAIYKSTLEDYSLEIEKDGTLQQIPKEDFVNSYHYKFTPKSKGKFRFNGVLRYKWKGDWEEHPFNYNYIVK